LLNIVAILLITPLEPSRNDALRAKKSRRNQTPAGVPLRRLTR